MIVISCFRNNIHGIVLNCCAVITIYHVQTMIILFYNYNHMFEKLMTY